eukprot:scaffold1992_cov187-Amphora_coffeaeformis.AAC.13
MKEEKQNDKQPLHSATSNDENRTSVVTDEEDDSLFFNPLEAAEGEKKDVKEDDEKAPATMLQRQVARGVSVPGAHAIAGPAGSVAEPEESASHDWDLENQWLPSPPPPTILTATLVQEDKEPNTPKPSNLLYTLTASTPVLAHAELAEDEETATNEDSGAWQRKQQHSPKRMATTSRCHLIFCCGFIAVLIILSGLGVGLAFALRPDDDSSTSLKRQPKPRIILDDDTSFSFRHKSHPSMSRSDKGGNETFQEGGGDYNDVFPNDRDATTATEVLGNVRDLRRD